MARKISINPNEVSRAMFLEELHAAVMRATKRLGRERGAWQMIADHLRTSQKQIRRWREGIGPTNTHMAKLYISLKSF